MIFPSCRWWSCACSRVATITSLFRFESNRFRSTRSDWRLRACPKTASPASSFTRRQLGKLFICSGRCAPVNCERNRLFYLLFLSWKNKTRFFGPPCAFPRNIHICIHSNRHRYLHDGRSTALRPIRLYRGVWSVCKNVLSVSSSCSSRFKVFLFFYYYKMLPIGSKVLYYCYRETCSRCLFSSSLLWSRSSNTCSLFSHNDSLLAPFFFLRGAGVSIVAMRCCFLNQSKPPPIESKRAFGGCVFRSRRKPGRVNKQRAALKKKTFFLPKILSQAKARKMSLAVLLRKPSYRLQCQREHEIELS